MIEILFHVATGGLVFTAVVLVGELWRLRRARRRRQQQREPERTVLDEVRELRQLGATIDAQAADLTTRLEALEKTLAASRATGPRARPERVAPRSA